MEIYFGSAFANMNLLSSSIGLAVTIPVLVLISLFKRGYF